MCTCQVHVIDIQRRLPLCSVDMSGTADGTVETEIPEVVDSSNLKVENVGAMTPQFKAATPPRSPGSPKSLPNCPVVYGQHSKVKITFTENLLILHASKKAMAYFGKNIEGKYLKDIGLSQLAQATELDWNHLEYRTIICILDRVNPTSTPGKSEGIEIECSTCRMSIEGSMYEAQCQGSEWIYSTSIHAVVEPIVEATSPKLSALTGGLNSPGDVEEFEIASAAIVELQELEFDEDGNGEWHETARFQKGLEQDVYTKVVVPLNDRLNVPNLEDWSPCNTSCAPFQTNLSNPFDISDRNQEKKNLTRSTSGLCRHTPSSRCSTSSDTAQCSSMLHSTPWTV